MSNTSSPARSRRFNIFFFLCGILFLGSAAGIFETTFNNYLSDIFAISADVRGKLEFPREFPGFAAAFLIGLLFFLSETRIAALAALLVGAGMLGLAALGDEWWLMVGLMVLWSVGTHLMIPIQSAIAVGLSNQHERGKLLGRMSGTGTAATILGAGLVWVITRYFVIDYYLTFAVGGGLALVAMLLFWQMRVEGSHLKRPKFVWNRKYWLYYLLALIFGARKQVFITFAPWVLVREYAQEPYIIAQLWMTSSAIGIFFHPLLGRLIDRLGERTILVGNAVGVFVICLGYGLSHHLQSQWLLLHILYACFVCDHLLFGTSMARTTYLSKIALRREDISPTLALGVSLDHVISMLVPALGGMLWVSYGYPAVFYAAAAVAVVMLGLALLIPSRRALGRVQYLGGRQRQE